MINKLMMFTLFFLFFLTTSFNTFAFNESKDAAIESLLTRIELNTFIKQIKQIKKFKSVDEIDSLDYELRYFFKNIKQWYFFDQKSFKSGFARKLKVAFSEREISRIHSAFKKPFLIKVLNSTILYRNIFSFNERSISEKFKATPLVKSRYVLIKNIYNLNGMSLQKEEMVKRLSRIINTGKVVVRVLKLDKAEDVFVDPIELGRRVKNAERFMIEYLATDLKSFRHYELREYIRIFKNQTLIQKFLHLYANYHFSYLSRYIEKVETDKLNQLKTINTAI
jgi:hypothetical protein